MPWCRECSGTGKDLLGERCSVCKGLGMTTVEVAREQAIAVEEADPFPDEGPTRVPCSRCLCCEVCSGTHFATPERNQAYRDEVRRKAGR